MRIIPQFFISEITEKKCLKGLALLERKKNNGPPTSNFDQNSKRQKQHGEPCPSIENFRIMVHPQM
jgi:hypothetical protein